MITMRCGNRLIGGSIGLAATFWKRFAGLMFRRPLGCGEGLLLMPCSSIHMCFMRMALDVVYLDANFRVMAVERALKPWRPGKVIKGVRQVLELPVGTIDRCGIAPGSTLAVEAALLPETETRGIHGEQTGNCVES